MARILALSSQVARGHVGLSAMQPALNALGHEVIALPTVILSNHPGHPASAGQRIEPGVLDDMTGALAANGWLDEVAAIVTGYLPTAGHVRFAAAVVDRLKARRGVLYLCDPVIGDEETGLYLDPLAAGMLRSELMGRADILTPNRFEAGWLTGTRPATLRQLLDETAPLARQRIVAITSAERVEGRITNVFLRGEARIAASVEWRDGVPHGTGDLFAALFAGHLLDGESDTGAFGAAVAGVDQVVRASAGLDELALVAALPAAVVAEPLAPEPVR